MPNDGPPLFVEKGKAIDWIVLDRPENANALSTNLLEALSSALAELVDTDAPVIGIRGAGKGFSAGVDLSEYNASATPMDDVARLRRNVERWLDIWRHPKPVIAAIHGYCLGIAAQLPSFADITVVARDARIGEPAIPLGGGFIAPTWVAQVGAKRAKELSFLPGNTVTGEQAARWGWANAAVPSDCLVDCVEALADRIALVPGPVLTMKKLSINRAMEAQGFLTSVNAIAESDAILHLEPEVLALRDAIAQRGLKSVLQSFSGPPSRDIFEQFDGLQTDG